MPLDPNLVYVILIIGLWLSVTAVHTPGTGVIELLAGAAMIGALWALTTLPTNWWALALIVIGTLGFIIMPFLDRRLVLLAVGGLALQAVGSVLLFNGIGVSLLLITVMIGVSLLYYRFALLRVLAYHRNSASALIQDEPLIGTFGYVKQTLDPVGTVYVRGEMWTARSDDKIESGTPITVVDQDGLTLFVEAVKQKHHPEEA